MEDSSTYPLSRDEYVELFSALCSWFWYHDHPDWPDDGQRHTSEECRAAARGALDCLRIVTEPGFEEPEPLSLSPATSQDRHVLVSASEYNQRRDNLTAWLWERDHQGDASDCDDAECLLEAVVSAAEIFAIVGLTPVRVPDTI